MVPSVDSAKPRNARPGVYLVAALFVLCVSLVALEAMLRLVQRFVHGTPVFTLLPGFRPTQFQLSPFLVFGPRVDWRPDAQPVTDWTWFNSQGFRTPETVGARRPGEFRIVTLGGSTTEDVWNRAGLHWPLVLECELHRAGFGNVRVLNAAMSAYSSAHSLVRLATDILEYEPDLVIVMHNINDLAVVYEALSRGVPLDHNYLARYGRKTYTGTVDETDIVMSRLARAARTRLSARHARAWDTVDHSVDVDRGAALLQRNIRSIHAVAQHHGADVVFLTMPVSRDPQRHELIRRSHMEGRAGIGALPSYDRFHRDFDTYNAAIRKLEDHGLAVVDMARLFPDDEAHFADLVHYSTAGVLAFGRTLAPHVAGRLRPPGNPGPAVGCAWARDPAVRNALVEEGLLDAVAGY